MAIEKKDGFRLKIGEIGEWIMGFQYFLKEGSGRAINKKMLFQATNLILECQIK